MKKTLSFLVALLLTLSLAVVPALADEPASVVGYSASRIEKKNLDDIPCIQLFFEDAYSKATEFKISSVDDLKMFNQLTNEIWQTFKGITIYLENDLDLGGAVWKPVGYNTGSSLTNCFEGTFDGQGHVIDNFKVEESGESLTMIGFFGTLKKAVVKNLVIGSNASVTYTGKFGDVRTAGLVGCLTAADALVDNCYVMATVTSSTQYAGGIVGTLIGANSAIKNCTFGGTVTGAQRVGGILGYLGNTSMVIDNCRNTGTIINTGKSSGCYTGGIVGMLNNKAGVCSVTNCINNGEIQGTGTSNGAISGMTRGATTYSGCVNYGTVNNPTELFTTTGIFGAYYETADADKQVIGEGNQNLMGQTDATLETVPTITPNFYTGKCELPEEDDEPGNVTPPAGDSDGETNDDKPATQTTAKPDTATTAKPDSTNAATTGADTSEENSGCSSAIGGSVAILLAFGAVAVVSKKRR